VNDPPARLNEPRMLAWLRSLFLKPPAPIPPVLVRARTGGRTAREVEVEAVWHPSGKRRAYRAKDAQGLCMLPWVHRAERVSMRVRADGAERFAEIEVDAEEAHTGQVIDLVVS